MSDLALQQRLRALGLTGAFRQRDLVRMRQVEGHLRHLLGGPDVTFGDLGETPTGGGGPQRRGLADDDIVHLYRHLGGHERVREPGVGPESQHQRIDDPLHRSGQGPAVIGTEHLDPRADGTPRVVDHRAAGPHGDRRSGAGTHPNRIEVGFGSGPVPPRC